MDDNVFADRLAYHWGELTALHPSLDGNTRSQRVFVDQLTQETGRSIDWAAVNQNISAFKVARLHAHAGNHEPLRDQLAQVIRPQSTTRPTGPELAGPAVDPAVTKAALSGPATPGSAGTGTTATVAKKQGRTGRGREGNELS